MSGAEGLGEAGSGISLIGMSLSLPKGVGVEMLLLGNVGGKCSCQKGHGLGDLFLELAV